MEHLRLIGILLILLAGRGIVAQISPPGLDDTHTVMWGAAGFIQPLGNRWTTTVYAGLSRESNPDNYAPVYRAAIVVLNQETQFSFSPHWQASLCSSFRVQNRYSSDEPYAAADPPRRDEVRLYSRLYYRFAGRDWNFTFSFRPEFRLFYRTDFTKWDGTPGQVRLRLKAQVARPLDQQKRNQIIIANEWLSVTNEVQGAGGRSWTPFQFSEDRFTTYFRHTFKKPSLIFDVGVMHQFSFAGDKSYVAHLAFDVLLQNPFGKKRGS